MILKKLAIWVLPRLFIDCFELFTYALKMFLLITIFRFRCFVMMFVRSLFSVIYLCYESDSDDYAS